MNTHNTPTKTHTQKREPSFADLSIPAHSDFSRRICSSTDCTGLIPALPDSDAELEAYEEMYAFCQRCVTPQTTNDLKHP